MKNKKKQENRKIFSNKKLALSIVMALGIIGLVTAAWYFSFNSSLSVRVDSIGGLQNVALTIPAININTTNGSASGSGLTSFVFNKAATFQVSITETYGDLSGGECDNGTLDCSIIYGLFDGNSFSTITDGQTISIPENTNMKTISANMSCVAYSCPQTRDIILRLNQVA